MPNSNKRCNLSVEEQYKVPSIPSSQVPPTIAPDQAAAEPTELHDSLKFRGMSELDSPLHPPSQSDNTRDEPDHLDIQYIDLIVKLQSLLKKSRKWLAPNTPLEKSDAISSLQTTLVDLQVWAYDLSDTSALFLEYLRHLSSHNHTLKTMLQRIFDDIGCFLTWIDEADVYGKDWPRAQDCESLLERCQRINGRVEELYSLKPSLRSEMSTWKKERPLSTARPSRSRPPTVLTFDGGGIKSYTSLLVLKTLMHYICDESAKQLNTPSQTVIRKPCEIFDFVFGSSSGGLIAIMLGRLEMTIEECIERFCAYSDAVFIRSNLRTILRRPFSALKYDGNIITQATRRLVGHFDPTPSHQKWKRNVFGTPHSRCKTGVWATSVSPKATSYMFRTYDCRMPLASEIPKWKPLNPGPASTHQIWEVARATSAAPTFFPPIHLDDKVFVDGGITANNPTQEALREVAFLHGELSGTCVVSIGSGISNDSPLPASLLSGKRMGFTHSKETVRVLRAALTQTELTNTDVNFEASMNTGFAYFRFNTMNERDIRLDDWDASGRTRTEIELSTKNYFESEDVKAQMRQCASAIVAKMAGSFHSFAGNVHYLVPRAPNSLFTGRTELLQYIRRCLASSKDDQIGLLRIFVITGMGGQGKSEICLKLAHDMREEFWGVFWVDVSTHSLAESDFIRVAEALGSMVKNLQDAIRVLANTKERWLLILDNADDPDIDYQVFLPSGEGGTVIITSRMRDCQQYNTIGAVTLDSLTNQELTELLLKASGISQIPSSSSSRQAEELISILGSHTLAIIQAGAYIAASHCRLDQYVELFQRYHQRMLRYGPRQAMSRYGNIYATFEAATTALDKGKCGTDALCLLGILSTLHASPVPIQIFEDAWKGSVRLRGFQTQKIPAGSTYLTQWHISQLPDFLGTAQVAEPSGFKVWDSFHLSEASHLLESLALVTRTDFGLSMHPLVHAWAKDRQSSSQQAQAWLITGSIIALSRHEVSLWHLHQLKLRPHLQSFLAVDIAAALSRGPEQSILGILLQCARILLQMRDDSDLAELLNRIFQKLNADPMNPLPVLLPFYELSARNLLNLGRHAEAFELLERIVKILTVSEKVLGQEHPDTLMCMNNLASVLLYQGNYEQAEEMNRRVLAAREKLLGEDHPDTLTSVSDLASVLQFQGKYEQAKEMNRQVLAAREKALGKDHPDTLTSVSNLALVLGYQGKYDQAEEMNRRALAGTEKVLGKEHPNTLRSMDNLALVLSSQGKYKEAEEMHRQALALTKRVLGKEHPDTLATTASLASTYSNQGRWREAEELMVQVMETRKKVLGEEHPSTLASMTNLASTHRDQGRWDEAIELIQVVVYVRRKTIGANHPDTLGAVDLLDKWSRSRSSLK